MSKLFTKDLYTDLNKIEIVIDQQPRAQFSDPLPVQD
jgi:hypothetical protein